MARALRESEDAYNETLKPVPPSDLHAKMEAALRAMGDSTEPIPDEAFTREWLCESFHLSPAQSARRIKQMVGTGVIKRVGRRGYTNYYVFTDDGQPKPGPKPIR